MSEFQPRQRDYRTMVHTIMEQMPVFGHLGLSIAALGPGSAEIVLPVTPELTFDGRHVQGGIVGALLDFAGGVSALTLAPEGETIRTLGYETHHLGPSDGQRLVAVGRVVKPGRNQGLNHVDVFAERGGERRLCAAGHVTTAWVPLG